jgi:hypothetical protein
MSAEIVRLKECSDRSRSRVQELLDRFHVAIARGRGAGARDRSVQNPHPGEVDHAQLGHPPTVPRATDYKGFQARCDRLSINCRMAKSS